MKNLINLNKAIEKIYTPNIIILNNYKSIKVDGFWVQDIYADYNFFNNCEEKITSKIDYILALKDPINTNYIKLFHQDILQKYNDIKSIDYKDLELLKAFNSFPVVFDSTRNLYKKNSSEFYYNPDNHEAYGDFLERITKIYKVDYVFDNDSIDGYDADRMIVNDMILKKLEADETQLDEFYSLALLSYCLDNYRDLLKRIAEYLDSYVNLITKLENFENKNLTLNDVFDDLDKIKLEFKLDKIEVAMFYKALHDEGIIYVNNQGQTHFYTNLKKYINNANLNYLEKSKSTPIKNINKEFSKFLNDNKYEEKEIKLLDFLIDKFTERKNKIIDNHQEGLL